jgi:hypothetical protein
MLALPNMLDFFAHKFACLCGRSFAFSLCFVGAFKSFFFWHSIPCSFLASKMDLR